MARGGKLLITHEPTSQFFHLVEREKVSIPTQCCVSKEMVVCDSNVNSVGKSIFRLWVGTHNTAIQTKGYILRDQVMIRWNAGCVNITQNDIENCFSKKKNPDAFGRICFINNYKLIFISVKILFVNS